MNKRVYKDILWYFLGSFIPITIGILRSPIFTRIFSPEEYGYYSLITITFTYISAFLFSWLSSCIWRFYNQSKEQRKHKQLLSNILLIFFSSIIISCIITGIWLLFTQNMLVTKLVSLSCLFIITNEFIALFLVIDRLENKSLKFNIVRSTQSLLSFSFLLLLTLKFNFRIEAILMSFSLINIFIILYYLIVIIKSRTFKINLISKPQLIELFKFGKVGLVVSVCMLVLAMSDRYIISWLCDMDKVGIYNQTYQLGQISIAALITVFYNLINPKLNLTLTKNYTNSTILIKKSLIGFLLIILPLTVLFSNFSKQISELLLGEEFQSGYKMIPWIMTSAFFLGICQFNEMRLKFSDKYNKIIFAYVIATLLNIVLNIILVKAFDYEWAAITTLISYSILFLMLLFLDKNKDYLDKNILLLLIKLLLILGIEIAIDKMLRYYIEINIFLTIIEGCIFLSVFLLLNIKHLKLFLNSFEENN